MMIKPRLAEDPRFTPIVLRKQLLDEGWTERAIIRAVRDQQFVRVRHGSYVDYKTWQLLSPLGRHEVRLRAVGARAQVPLVASHISALALWEAPTWDLPLDTVHVTRPDEKAGRMAAGVIQHCGRLRESDVVPLHGLDVTSAARTCIDLTTITDVEHALCVINHFLHEKLVTMKELVDCEEFMRFAPDTLNTQLALRLADGRCESVGESRTLYLCYRQRLPAPKPQYEVTDALGALVARLDFAWPDKKVWLEFDGMVKYADFIPEGKTLADVISAEKARQRRVEQLTGWRCIRITWSDLAHPQRLAAEIRALLFPV